MRPQQNLGEYYGVYEQGDIGVGIDKRCVTKDGGGDCNRGVMLVQLIGCTLVLSKCCFAETVLVP